MVGHCSKCGKDSGASTYCKQCRHEYYMLHHNEFLQYAKDYTQKHLKKVREKSRLYYIGNKENLKEKRQLYSIKTKFQIIKYYSNSTMKCACCGENNIKFLTLDHIIPILSGGSSGNRQRKRHGCGFSFYRWLIKNNFPKGFQVLCWNCNCARFYNDGICPHKEESRET